MTKNEISAFKLQCDQLANYYSNLGFDILCNHFRNVVNFLTEMENQCDVIDNLNARIQSLEAGLQTMEQIPATAQEIKEEEINETL